MTQFLSSFDFGQPDLPKPQPQPTPSHRSASDRCVPSTKLRLRLLQLCIPPPLHPEDPRAVLHPVEQSPAVLGACDSLQLLPPKLLPTGGCPGAWWSRHLWECCGRGTSRCPWAGSSFPGRRVRGGSFLTHPWVSPPTDSPFQPFQPQKPAWLLSLNALAVSSRGKRSCRRREHPRSARRREF